MQPAPLKPECAIDDLDKLDLRIGTITKVDDVPKSDKLVKLTVDFGDMTRTILSGMKQEREDPAEIEGLQALFLVNLKPRKMMGLESQGMIVDVGYPDGILPALLQPERTVPNGTRAG